MSLIKAGDTHGNTLEKPETIAICAVGTAYSGKAEWAQATLKSHENIRGIIIAGGGHGEKEENWKEQIEKALSGLDVLIITMDRLLDPGQLRDCAAYLNELGISDLSIQYFPPRPLWDLLRLDSEHHYALGAQDLKRQLGSQQIEDKYWEAVELVSRQD